MTEAQIKQDKNNGESTFIENSDGPWYENSCPNAEYVRKDQLSRITRHYNIQNKNEFAFHHRVIKNTLEAFLPDGMDTFGSYRGYATFGLDPDIEKQITQAYVSQMNNYEHNMQVLRTKLTPYLLHYLYKPGGKRTPALASHFTDTAAAAAGADIASASSNPPIPPGKLATQRDNHNCSSKFG